MPGCRAVDPKVSDAFVRNREGTLASALRSSATAQERAAEAALEGLAESSRAYESRRTDADAYSDARRWLYTTESRAREAFRHAARAETVRDELVDQWTRDLRNYTEDALRDQGRERLRQLEEDSDAVFADLAAARAAVEPVRRRIVDRTLWLKQYRGGTVPPEHTTSPETRAAIETEASSLRELTAKAAASARSLADQLRPEEPEAGPETANEDDEIIATDVPTSVLISSPRAKSAAPITAATRETSEAMPVGVSDGVPAR
jgi:hypothetical protein